MEPMTVTKEMLDGVKTDIDLFRTIPSKVKCDSIETYDRIMKYYSQLHISAYSDKETLIIVA